MVPSQSSRNNNKIYDRNRLINPLTQAEKSRLDMVRSAQILARKEREMKRSRTQSHQFSTVPSSSIIIDKKLPNWPDLLSKQLTTAEKTALLQILANELNTSIMTIEKVGNISEEDENREEKNIPEETKRLQTRSAAATTPPASSDETPYPTRSTNPLMHRFKSWWYKTPDYDMPSYLQTPK